jgi:hypothetical protein
MTTFMGIFLLMLADGPQDDLRQTLDAPKHLQSFFPGNWPTQLPGPYFLSVSDQVLFGPQNGRLDIM